MGTRVPPGPSSAARTNVVGLTERQLAVLGVISEGLTNAEIADRLVVSGPHRRPPCRGGALQAR
jgi:DNA-binding NarL/FixJ family response regulator